MFVIPLKKLRIKNGLTQQELSTKSGIAQGIISGIESGATQNPRFDTVVKLAEALMWLGDNGEVKCIGKQQDYGKRTGFQDQ